MILQNLKSSREDIERIKNDIQLSREKNPSLDILILQSIKERHRQKIDVSSLDISGIDSGYSIIITDDTIASPFSVNVELLSVIKPKLEGNISYESKARTIYGWIEQNIEYGKAGNKNSYISSKEVLSLRKGICAEMAFLYIAMARSIGLRSNFVSVDRDCFSKKVNHACASFENGSSVLVDPAYHIFGAKHQKYRIWKDCEIMDVFGRMEGR